MKIKRSPFQVVALFSALLIGLTLLMPARAFATDWARCLRSWPRLASARFSTPSSNGWPRAV